MNGNQPTHAPIAPLFVPGTKDFLFAKALTGVADAVIFDLEDSVSELEKENARENIFQFLSGGGLMGKPEKQIFVRVNSLNSRDGEADMQMLEQVNFSADGDSHFKINGLFVPKMDAEILSCLSARVELPVVAQIETATGVASLAKVCASPQVARLALGAIDLSVDLGCGVESMVIDSVRAQMVVESVRAGLCQPLDSPSAEFRDRRKITELALKARLNGFGGMLCIHPAQADVVLETFAPSQAEISWARKVLEVVDGVGTVDGQMVDRPVKLRAKAILQRAARG